MPAAFHKRSSLPPVIEAMLQPQFYPHPASDIELRQTHTSYVLLAGEFAYKVRKAVRFAFIDCSTAARRRVLCQREMDLNRRLSPDVYLGVVAIVQSGGRIILDQSADNPSGAIEFAVKMRRLPQDQRLDSMIKRDAATAGDIIEIAKTIGSFHDSTPNTHSWAYGAAANIWRMTIGNLAEIEQLGPEPPLLKKIAQVEEYCRRYVAAHWELLNQRARAGRVRDGHGDLRADAVYLTSNGIRIIDCLEFDERLRYGDIANEVAFLAMDIERLGRPDLSRALLGNFVRDPDVPLLAPFYKCYRATVRAKVELLRSRQVECSAEDQQAALISAAHLLDLALDYAQGEKVLLIVCGASGTGKSTLASVLSGQLAIEVLNSDVERKGLAAIEPTTPAAALYNEGIYAPEFTRRVYASLLAGAKRVLNMGKGVIVDATFGKRSQRQLAIEMTKEAGVQPLFIECRADQKVIMRRLLERGQDPQRVSDATVEIYLTQIKEFEPFDELPPAWHQVVDTTRDLATNAVEIERRVYGGPFRSEGRQND